MTETDRTASRRTVRGALDRLAAAQKTSKGAPAYSRYVNRWLGRRFAAVAYVADLTPNKVTALSALCTFAGIALIASVAPSVGMAVAVVIAFVVGYALDSADGQLARLQGSGSPAGEWLDHTIDATKIATLHCAVLLSWFRFEEERSAWLLVPLAYSAVASVQFFSMVLTDQLRRAHRGSARGFLQGDGSSSVAYSFAVLPTDFGLLCVAFLLFDWHAGFRVVYLLLLAANTGFMVLALPKWFREVRGFGGV